MLAHWIVRQQFRLVLAIMLGVVLFQTAPSGDLAMQRDHGSAFSAATVDLALPVRSAGPQITTVAPEPLPAIPPTVAFAIARADIAITQTMPRPCQTGPPTRPPRLPATSPRAPPLTA